MSKERENNFDLLRILCTIGVILLHISSIFMNGVTDETFISNIHGRSACFMWHRVLRYLVL